VSQSQLPFYTDHDCTAPSTTASNTSLALGVCIVTPGMGSFEQLPVPCQSGSVQNYVFADTACGQLDGGSYYRTGDGHCYAAFTGGMAAMMLSCDQTAPGQPIATTTIDVGPVATSPAQTSSPSSSSSGSGTDTGSGTTSSSSPTSNPSSLSSGWNSLDKGVRIGIIVSLAIGVLLTLYLIAMKKQKRRQQEEGGMPHGRPMQTNLDFHGGANEAYHPQKTGRQVTPGMLFAMSSMNAYCNQQQQQNLQNQQIQANQQASYGGYGA
jgi:hypothetical protein